jgi:hypothetical protein
MMIIIINLKIILHYNFELFRKKYPTNSNVVKMLNG